MKLTLSVTKTQEEDLHIEVPSFWRNISSKSAKYDYIAIIDENTICTVNYLRDYVSITNCTPCPFILERLVKKNCLNDYQPVSEEEFLSIYSEAIEAASLAPRLIEKESYVDDLASIGVIGKEVSHES